jgi:chromosome segregation ATPase
MNVDKITSQIISIQKQHEQLLQKLLIIQEKVSIFMSEKGGENKEIKKLVKDIEKLKKQFSDLSEMQKVDFDKINTSFEEAKKEEDEDEKIKSLKKVKKRYDELKEIIDAEKISKIDSEIKSIITSITKSIEKKYPNPITDLEIKNQFNEIQNQFNEIQNQFSGKKLEFGDLIKLKNDLEEIAVENNFKPFENCRVSSKKYLLAF